jgi:DHA1 family inner membrane transport protein
MAFFHNRTVNLLNLHYIIASIAQSGGGAFYGVWLLKSGIALPGVLLTLAAIFALRLVMRLIVLPLAIRFGLRSLVALGTIAMGLSFVFLAEVHGADWSLLRLVLAASLADSIYWPSYHAYFAALGDADHRGQQLGLREGSVAVLGIVSPLATSWLLVVFGPRAAFYTTGAFAALAALPLLWMPDVRIAPTAPGALRAAVSGAMLFVGDGWIAAGYFIVWQVALFLALGRDVMAYGGALAIAALVGAASGLFLGRLIDAGRGTRAVWLSGGVLVFVILMRAAVAWQPALAIAANALGAFVACLYVPTMMTAVYNQAKRSPCVMRFHIVAEGGWDVGVTTGLSLAALLVWRGSAVATTILLSLAGAAFVLVLLGRYYTAHPTETVDASQTRPEEAAKI